METVHVPVFDDARDLSSVADNAVELVVTSPPYPMIELWDDIFAELDTAAGARLDEQDGPAAFEAMHEALDAVWAELRRVLIPGGIACINIGDATRRIGDSFRVYPNHARITSAFESLGFDPLPDVLWRKPSNSAAKFMGSGMLPPNAYVTLEHEYILVFRNGSSSRQFDPGLPRRYQSAYFWEERNRWFSDVWSDVNGELQSIDHDTLRERSAAYPFEIPYRLINMYSIRGDTVLDPFWGTGTTSIAAMVAARNSIGYELDPAFESVFSERVDEVAALSADVVETRLRSHAAFVERERDAGATFEYDSHYYDVPVRTQQEREIRFYRISSLVKSDGEYVATAEPVPDDFDANP
ncbi:DNA-methyltransferase [Haloferacaceae archaeon DSL9]